MPNAILDTVVVLCE